MKDTKVAGINRKIVTQFDTMCYIVLVSLDPWYGAFNYTVLAYIFFCQLKSLPTETWNWANDTIEDKMKSTLTITWLGLYLIWQCGDIQ